MAYSTRINVWIPNAFLKVLDQAAQEHGISRSGYIRIALLEKTGVKSLTDPRYETRHQKHETFLDELDEMARQLDAVETDSVQ